MDANVIPIPSAEEAAAPVAAKTFSPAEVNTLSDTVQAKRALLAQLREELKVAQTQLKTLTAEPNKHLVGMAPDKIVALMPKQIRVEVFFNDHKVGEQVMTPAVSKNGLVGCAESSNVVITLPDGSAPMIARVKSAVFVPLADKKKKVKPDGEKKHKKAKTE